MGAKAKEPRHTTKPKRQPSADGLARRLAKPLAPIAKMIDKPIPSRIILSLANTEATGEEFVGLSTTLYRQNLIYSEPRELRKKEAILELTIIFQDITSFTSWKSNPEVVEYYLPKFKAVLNEEPITIQETDVIIEVDKVVNCTCGNPSFYILQGRTHQYFYELICNNCLGQIPYSRVPINIELENWQRHHQRVYLNWLETSFFEKEALKQLTDYKNGKLNLEGEKLRKQISAFFGVPVYINFFTEEPDKGHRCLICGEQGELSGLKMPSKICKRCNTAF